MDILEKIRGDGELTEKVDDFCDLLVYGENQEPDDWGGKLSWSIHGKAFGSDGSGGVYLLLEDGSVGYSSSEGENGRVAESVAELFALLVNCSCWMDYLYANLPGGRALLERFTAKAEAAAIEDYNKLWAEDGVDYPTRQKELAEALELPLYGNLAEGVLGKLFAAALREPKYVRYFREKDGSLTCFEDLLVRDLTEPAGRRMGL